MLTQLRNKLSFFIQHFRYLNSVQFKNTFFVTEWYVTWRFLSENWSKEKNKCALNIVHMKCGGWVFHILICYKGNLFFGDPVCTFVLPVISYFKLDRESIHCCIISFSGNSFYSLQQVFTEKCWCLLICFLSYKCACAWFVAKLAFLTALNVICIAQQDCYIEQMWFGVVILCNYHH